MHPTSSTDIPAAARVVGTTIIELVLDHSRRQTGLLRSAGNDCSIEQRITLESGETIVPYSGQNNLIAHDCILLPERPEEYGGKAKLVSDIAAYLHRYVDLSPVFEQIAAHYVLLSWVYDAFSEVPYLRVRGNYGTGKTRALIAIGSICYRPFFAAGASTVSPIFHTMDRFRGTLVLDEADLRFSDSTADLVKLFNNGTVRGLPVLRTIQNRNREFNPAAFDVFGPKIIAMRGSFDDEALESRFLTEETGTKPMRPDIPIHLPTSLHTEALSLRNRLLQFRLTERLKLSPLPLRVQRGLDARTNQIILPLLALMDDEVLRDHVGERLRSRRLQLDEARRNSVPARILKAALELLAAGGGGCRVSVQAIAQQASALSDGELSVSAKRAGIILRDELGMRTHKSNGVFVVTQNDRAKLESSLGRFNLT